MRIFIVGLILLSGSLAFSGASVELVSCKTLGNSRYNIKNLTVRTAQFGKLEMIIELADSKLLDSCAGDKSRKLSVEELQNQHGEVSGYAQPIPPNQRNYTVLNYSNKFHGEEDGRVYFDANLTSSNLPCGHLAGFNTVKLYCSMPVQN